MRIHNSFSNKRRKLNNFYKDKSNYKGKDKDKDKN